MPTGLKLDLLAEEVRIAWREYDRILALRAQNRGYASDLELDQAKKALDDAELALLAEAGGEEKLREIKAPLPEGV